MRRPPQSPPFHIVAQASLLSDHDVAADVVRLDAPDPIFANPRLAALCDPLEAERPDLDFYVSLVESFGARRVLDVGCGTGVFACRLARRGVDVVGLDPAEASLSVARQKPDAARVRWIMGDAKSAPPLDADLATMTGNVAQVFLTEDEWSGALQAIGQALRPEGRLIFETRDPAKEAWLSWTREKTYRRVEIAGVGAVKTWCEVTRIEGPLVAFRWTHEFEADGAVLVSDSILRFRGRAEIARSLEVAGYLVEDVLAAPDRPGLEFVFIARRAAETAPAA